MANMTTLQILQGVHDWVLDKIDEETANFITKTVNDLVNYYTKSETYTKAEVQQIVDTIKQFTYEVVQVLPTASASTMNKIYLVPAPESEDKNVKEEYITIQNGSTYSWEMFGTTSIDLSNYYTKGQTDSAITAALNSALSDYTTTEALTALLSAKQDAIQDLATIRSGASSGDTAVQPSALESALVDTVAKSGVFDLSVHNAVNGVPATYANLSAALTALNALESKYKYGGMSFKFVCSSDNKYVQWRYMGTATTGNPNPFLDESNWQGVDFTPAENSQNLIESGGVKKVIGRNEDYTIANSAFQSIGVGYPLVVDGKVKIDDTDKTSPNYNNRQTFLFENIDRYCVGSLAISCKSYTDVLCIVLADDSLNVLASKTATSVALTTYNFDSLPIGTKYILISDDFTTVNGYVKLKPAGLIHQVEQNKAAITQLNEKCKDGVNALQIIEGADNIQVNGTNATILGKGYIKTDNGKVLDEVDTSPGYGNRKVLKYNIQDYIGGSAEIHAKSDNGFLQYAIVDSQQNILSSHTSTTLGQFFNGTIEIPLNAYAIYLGDDYYQNQAYAKLANNGLYKDVRDLQEEVNQQSDFSRYNLVEEWFTVRVNSTRPTSESTDDYDYNTDGETYYDDNCYIGFPNNVKADTKLIIMFHGGGEPVGTDASSMAVFNYACVAKTYRALGYAVLMTNGMPDLWAQEQGLENSSAPIGNWMALESTIKAYQYVTEKYPCIDKKGCYLWATSQGGMVAENFVELCDIPVRACCYQAPALSMRYVQLYLTFRLPWIQALYGFNSIATYSKDKCLGLDPFVRNVDTDIPIVGTTFAEIAQTDVDSITSKKFRKGVPLLILHGTADMAVSPVITKAYIKAINNAGGCMAKYKLFEGVGHGVASPTTQDYQGTTPYAMTGYTPTPTYTTAGILEFAKWYYRYGGYPIPSGYWGNAIQ